jgi:hypothetical protein
MLTHTTNNWHIRWVDGKRDPKNPPDPDYPNGIDLDLSDGSPNTCSSPLPYPAARCGYYLINCLLCGQNTVATTAGRIDDPRSLKMACKERP